MSLTAILEVEVSESQKHRVGKRFSICSAPTTASTSCEVDSDELADTKIIKKFIYGW